MKNIKPFGPSIGKTKISKKFLNILNKEIDNKVLTNKNIGMIFEKYSTRTRLSFAVAISNLGGDRVDVKFDELNFSRGESFEDTFKTTFNIIEALNNSKTKVEKFIFASSSAIYGYKKNIKIKENLGDLKPISYYGAMKAASENLLSSYSFLNNTKCFIFRFHFFKH